MGPDHAKIASILGSTFGPARGGRPTLGPGGTRAVTEQYLEGKAKAAKRPRYRYRVLTWDIDLQKFTPQKGVRSGPYTLFGLRKALRKLREMGYSARRVFDPDHCGWSDPCVLVERIED
jgi:hypothetical protein